MSASWLYRQDSIWIVLALLVVMTLAGEIAYVLGRRLHPKSNEARIGHLRAVVGSLLGLLALLLSFTFAMSAERYDARRKLVIRDANTLGQLYLQSDLLPDAPRKTFKQLLSQYVNLRAQVALFHHDATDTDTAQAAVRSGDVHQQMWKVIKGVAVSQPPVPVADEMLRALIEAMSIHRERIFSWESRVPDPVIYLLLFGAVTAISAIGFFGGLGDHRGLPARIAVTILLAGTVYVTLDLDKPHQGLIRVSQSPMLHLQSTLQRDPEAKQ